MTTAEMLASVEVQIRKDIPRLMELREDCYVKEKIMDYLYKIYRVTDNCYNLYRVSDNDKWDVRKETYDKHKPFEIVGHEIMLYDVLEWLSLCKKTIYFIDSEYGFGILDVDCHRFYHFKFDINLKSPYLRHQSEKLIKFLYGVMKNRL